MNDRRQSFPLLAKHAGEWRGEYIHLDANAVIIDRHASHLDCRLPEDGSADIVQVNTYTWADGRQEKVEFSGRLRGRDVLFDNERIVGHMHQSDDQTILLTWSYKSDPDNYLYELIQLSRDGLHKCRTWHWMVGDRLAKRTVISESKIV